ncbi:hypothetical protein GALMADRAFT_132212 [Galerina marginata CBS 339.88]|uniref:Uncharacterized protein n=1 Tax=Galerina marginata (strain CBS 339.88) TaxID=685588 RepID=A0A067TQQ1_GALM3|nr:hypothetical protein GALMADRAFT_132212 [Galerina marginata CBS 339.88]
MPSYFAAPSSPTFGLFPTGVTSPNAFSGFHQNPREAHNIVAAFSSSGSKDQEKRLGDRLTMNRPRTLVTTNTRSLT